MLSEMILNDMKQLLLLLPILQLLAVSSAQAAGYALSQPAVLYSTDNQGTSFQRGVNYRRIDAPGTTNTPVNFVDASGISTPGQFRGVVVYGALVRPGPAPNGPPANVEELDLTQSYEANARKISLAHGPSTGPVKYVLRASQAGAATYSRNTSFLFGAVIPPPDTDVSGLPLNGIAPADYWFAEPFTQAAHTNSAYHWSPHAQAVFAATVGPVSVVWRKRIPDQTATGNLNVDFMEQSGLKYRLRKVVYIVSGTASEEPRRIYWTGGSYTRTGKPVRIPAGRVNAIRFAYNNTLPITVDATNRYVDPLETSPVDGATDADGNPVKVLRELRTIWYDTTQGQINAYNREGRIMLELLGEELGDGRRRFLDTEIVDVYREVPPVDLRADLGEIITPAAGVSAGDHDLTAEPVPSKLEGRSYLYGQPIPSRDSLDYYATRETTSLNAVLVHWLEEGDQGLLWPKIYARYKLDWPTDESSYSHYLRAPVASRNAARETAVLLPAVNAPHISYQDPFLAPDGACAEITEDSKFNTWLVSSHAVHRTLLRYQSRGLVTFERVISWMNTGLKNPDSLADTVATNLTGWSIPNPLLSAVDIADSGQFARLLDNPGNNKFGRYLARQLSPETRAALEAFRSSEWSDETAFRNALAADLNGILQASTGQWISRDTNRNWQCIAASADGMKVVAGVDSGYIYVSTNAGISWSATGAPFSRWQAVASSSDGTKLVAAGLNSQLWMSTDSGATWTARGTTRQWASVASSSDGSNLVAAVDGGQLWTSNDGGITWTARESNRNWQSVASSSDGVKLIAIDRTVFSGTIHRSTDSGATWAPLADPVLNANDRWWTGVASSADGQVLVAINDGYNPGDYIYISTNAGGNWSKAGGAEMKRRWVSVALSETGQHMVAVEKGFNEYGAATGINLHQGQVYTSTNFGVTWQEQLGAPKGTWAASAISQDGVVSFVGLAGGALYTQDRYPGFHNGYQSDRQFLAETLPGMVTRGQTLVGPGNLKSPRLVTGVIDVGSRIDPPEVDMPGYILQGEGDLFHASAYRDPFASGFAAAASGAIIPVNAIPTKNHFEVWWFRGSRTDSVRNTTNGFEAVYWPTVIGRYTSQWPVQPEEIVLASNAGSGALESIQQTGTIYVQNDSSKVGYNPNEEHALMVGGRAYALRDDLNVTGSISSYSSAPFVLLDYTKADGRPAIRPFKVVREKPTEGIVFDYVVEAGKQLQAPMPLPLLEQPVVIVTNVISESPREETYQSYNYNTEPRLGGGDWPANWQPDDSSVKAFDHYTKFTYKDRKEAFWVMRGKHAGLPALAAGKYDNINKVFDPTLPPAVAVVGHPFTNVIHTSRRSDTLVMTTTNALPGGLSISGTTVMGTPAGDAVGVHPVQLVITDTGDRTSVSVNVTISVVAVGGQIVQQEPLFIVSTNRYQLNNATYVGRPPFLAAAAGPTNAFTMRFYYKTQAGFAWPGNSSPPAIGTVVPYMRSVYSSGPLHAAPTAALDIVYRPVWPGNPPKMKFGQTLMNPDEGLPAIRGQSSVKILYQQSIAQDVINARPSVILHDPTSEKFFALKKDGEIGLKKIPAGVKTEIYQGRTYFPNLPPHLARRFFFDPARSPEGHLVYSGEFVGELLGVDYLHLNVLRGSDLAAVQSLCPQADAAKTDWDTAINSLSAIVLTKFENPKVPGQWITDLETESYLESLENNSPVSVGALPNTKEVSIGALIELEESETAANSYALSAAGPGQGYVTVVVGGSGNPDQTPAGEPVSLYVIRVEGSLYTGEVKIIPNENPLSELSTFQHSVDLGGRFADYQYEWKIAPPVDGFPPAVDATMSNYQPLTNIMNDLPRYTLGGSGIQGLIDNYIVLRYRPTNPAHPLYAENPTPSDWSNWTTPQLAEGWIKRVLAGINPFNQRVTDLYNNSINTDANILTAAGKRYEGDIALNLANINNYGLIEIYETVLKRGKNLSIDAGVPINFGPANDALLLAAGYLNDLYTLVGNEAFADAANPTIGIGTAHNTYGDVATSLFSFSGQLPSLLEEELALLRGRDDVAQPGVTTPPLYNRLVWNFTRGINSGEVIYALNYNILDQNDDGKVDAADAIHLYPQGHGDAYGHYLTAIKGYYTLLMNPSFDWVPRVEAVTVLGKPVTVDYLDERKFASSAAYLARAGKSIFDLTWRKDFVPGIAVGWGHLATNRLSKRTVLHGTTTTNIVREWGADQWASRVAQGSFYNWVVGNAILPEKDADPDHEGIQVVDRKTVPELTELVSTSTDLQVSMDNAEGRQTPLGMPQGAIAFDVNPAEIVGAGGKSHFEQIYERAKGALRNAVVSFDDAKSVTRRMRAEQDSLEELQTAIAEQERAYTNSLIELYGTPYTDDIGTGKFYSQGYAGPDLFHYMYTDQPQLTYPGLLMNTAPQEFKIDIQNYTATYEAGEKRTFDFVVSALQNNPKYKVDKSYISFTLDSSGSFIKPPNWKGRRISPGKLQEAIGRIQLARAAALQGLASNSSLKRKLDRAIEYFTSKLAADKQLQDMAEASRDRTIAIKTALFAAETAQRGYKTTAKAQKKARETALKSIPKSMVAGLSNGGDIVGPAARGGILAAAAIASQSLTWANFAKQTALGAGNLTKEIAGILKEVDVVKPLLTKLEHQQAVLELDGALGELQSSLYTINQRLQELDNAEKAFYALLAEGDRLQLERQVSRQRSASIIQGYRTRDAAFRIFRNEKLERYKTLFDLAARYAYLAANAYDYETGLLNTDVGKSFVNRIVNARALGVVANGEPQYAGSNSGDPGLSSVLAEMAADWGVIKGRLGFNNPDAYGTTVSLRHEKYRLHPNADGREKWQQILHDSRKEDLLADADVRRHCLQIDQGNGLAVPGLMIPFETTTTSGRNLFGMELSAGDSAFNPSSFATKIFAVGVALEGYRGMSDPTATSSTTGSTGVVSPTEPSTTFLDPQALAATPYVYLIPVGADAMRSPPLGDGSNIRVWNVHDVAIPLPFNIGASDFSTKKIYQSADSLTEPLFGIRKHQAFRPVSTALAFSNDIYGAGGSLDFSQYTNNRLIGRSAWNTKWKLVIPGNWLLNDPKEGLDRFIQTVTDIKLHFVTYSYAGN